jgi:hypothetical protein
MTDTGTFATVAITLYVSHHVADYWVQTDGQARTKGLAGSVGRRACTRHVVSYVLTQNLFLTVLHVALMPWPYPPSAMAREYAALLVSGVTHWTADRREHGLLFWLARRMPGKRAFLEFDQGHLASGAWALDQSWHIFWGVFVAALIVAS